MQRATSPLRHRPRPAAPRCRGGVSSLLRLSTPCARPAVGTAWDEVLTRRPWPVAGPDNDPKPGFITRLQPSEALPKTRAG